MMHGTACFRGGMGMGREEGGGLTPSTLNNDHGKGIVWISGRHKASRPGRLALQLQRVAADMTRDRLKRKH